MFLKTAWASHRRPGVPGRAPGRDSEIRGRCGPAVPGHWRAGAYGGVAACGAALAGWPAAADPAGWEPVAGACGDEGHGHVRVRRSQPPGLCHSPSVLGCERYEAALPRPWAKAGSPAQRGSVCGLWGTWPAALLAPRLFSLLRVTNIERSSWEGLVGHGVCPSLCSQRTEGPRCSVFTAPVGPGTWALPAPLAQAQVLSLDTLRLCLGGWAPSNHCCSQRHHPCRSASSVSVLLPWGSPDFNTEKVTMPRNHNMAQPDWWKAAGYYFWASVVL